MLWLTTPSVIPVSSLKLPRVGFAYWNRAKWSLGSRSSNHSTRISQFVNYTSGRKTCDVGPFSCHALLIYKVHFKLVKTKRRLNENSIVSLGADRMHPCRNQRVVNKTSHSTVQWSFNLTPCPPVGKSLFQPKSFSVKTLIHFPWGVFHFNSGQGVAYKSHYARQNWSLFIKQTTLLHDRTK